MAKFFLLILSALFLSSCSSTSSHKSAQSTFDADCLKIFAQNKTEELKTKFEPCLVARSKDGTTPLMIAAARGHHDLVSQLFRVGVKVNEIDNQGDTALNYAVVGNQVEMALYLLLNGADVKSQRPDGITSLMQATQFGSYAMVNALSQDRAGVNVHAEDGWTALYFAIRRKDLKILTLLIKQGACLTKKDQYDQTPVDFAKEVGWPEGLKALQKVPRCPS